MTSEAIRDRVKEQLLTPQKSALIYCRALNHSTAPRSTGGKTLSSSKRSRRQVAKS
jgi:hypothetical protein